jgi:hypothetical protein
VVLTRESETIEENTIFSESYAGTGKVAGSITDGVIGNFHWLNPSGSTMALVSTQPVTEMSTTVLSLGVKAAGVSGWQTSHIFVPIV